MFLNAKIYTDIKSYRVLSVNGNKATVIEVTRTPVNKEFRGHDTEWTEPTEIGVPFEIAKHRGYWGRWAKDQMYMPCVKSESVPTIIEQYKEREMNNVEIHRESVPNYPDYENLFITFLTPSGKPKKQFVKMNDHFDDDCRYFYDYTF